MVEAALGINAELLVNMQSRYNLYASKRKSSLLERMEAIRKACAAAAL